MSVDFTPSRGNYTELKPFRYWCQKVLPLVYDDSLSYYELLSKVLDSLNKAMEDVETLNDDVTALYTAYTSLQNWVTQYVENFFEGEGIENAVDDAIDRMVASGEFDAIVDSKVAARINAVVASQIGGTVQNQLPGVVQTQIPGVVSSQLPGIVNSQIGGIVNTWLEANITPDTTLLDRAINATNKAPSAYDMKTMLQAMKNNYSFIGKYTMFDYPGDISTGRNDLAVMEYLTRTYGETVSTATIFLQYLRKGNSLYLYNPNSNAIHCYPSLIPITRNLLPPLSADFSVVSQVMPSIPNVVGSYNKDAILNYFVNLKSNDTIKIVVDMPVTVTGNETPAVCLTGWKLAKIYVSGNTITVQNIADFTVTGSVADGNIHAECEYTFGNINRETYEDPATVGFGLAILTGDTSVQLTTYQETGFEEGVTYSNNTNYFPKGSVFNMTITGEVVDTDVVELKSDLDEISSKLTEIVPYTNQSTGQVGDRSAFCAYFNENTKLYAFKPLFSVEGTFKWGIFTANNNIDAGTTSQGTTEWFDTLETGSTVILNRTFKPNEGLVVQAIAPAYARNGLALQSCEIEAHLAQMNNAQTFCSHYFGKAYGFPATFYVPEIKDIPNTKELSSAVYVHPIVGSTHSALIQSAIEKAIDNDSRHVILQGGDFVITETIKVPSNFHLEFDNANVKLNSGANCNIIASANIDNLSSAENIVISGKNSVLDGNHSEQSISSSSYKRIGVLMFNVDGFDISGFTVKDTSAWGLSFESGCKNGKIHDIIIDQDGNSINQDGIDIRGGCHDIEIYNISGKSNDDFIACTAMLGNVMQVLNTGANGKDIYNIFIHDIRGKSGYCNLIDLICHDTCKTHDITICNIIEESPDGKEFEGNGAYSHAIMVGNYDFSNYAISGTPGTVDDMYNIKVSNVVTNTHLGIGIGWACKNVEISNVKLGANVIRAVQFSDGMQLQFDVKNLVVRSVVTNGSADNSVIYNYKAALSNSIFSDFVVGECYAFLTDFDPNNEFVDYENVAFLECKLFKGNRLYRLADNSAPFFDLFYIPSASAFTDLYPIVYKGQVQIGNNMPFHS